MVILMGIMVVIVVTFGVHFVVAFLQSHKSTPQRLHHGDHPGTNFKLVVLDRIHIVVPEEFDKSAELDVAGNAMDATADYNSNIIIMIV